jgi:hypothetical protein
MGRRAIAGVAGVLGLLFVPAAANAMSIVLPPSPTESSLVVHVQGTTPTAETYSVEVHVRPTSDGPCAENPLQDPHEGHPSFTDVDGGAYDITVPARWAEAGENNVCAWLEPQSGPNAFESVDSAQVQFTLLEPHASLRVFAPKRQRVSHTLQEGGQSHPGRYRARVTAEQSGHLTVAVLVPGAHRCAATSDDPNGLRAVFDNVRVRPGTHTFRTKADIYLRGRLLVCGWVTDRFDHTIARAHTYVRVVR